MIICTAGWQNDADKSIRDSIRKRKIDVAGVGVIWSNFPCGQREPDIGHCQEQQVAQMLAEQLHEHVAQHVDAHQPAEAYGAEHVSGGGFYRTMRRCRKKACRKVGTGGGDRNCRTTG